jgi:hypothetical protein
VSYYTLYQDNAQVIGHHQDREAAVSQAIRIALERPDLSTTVGVVAIDDATGRGIGEFHSASRLLQQRDPAAMALAAGDAASDKPAAPARRRPPAGRVRRPVRAAMSWLWPDYDGRPRDLWLLLRAGLVGMLLLTIVVLGLVFVLSGLFGVPVDWPIAAVTVAFYFYVLAHVIQSTTAGDELFKDARPFFGLLALAFVGVFTVHSTGSIAVANVEDFYSTVAQVVAALLIVAAFESTWAQRTRRRQALALVAVGYLIVGLCGALIVLARGTDSAALFAITVTGLALGLVFVAVAARLRVAPDRFDRASRLGVPASSDPAAPALAPDSPATPASTTTTGPRADHAPDSADLVMANCPKPPSPAKRALCASGAAAMRVDS